MTSIPLIGIGTYQNKDLDGLRRVLDCALACGYRLIDTAEVYKNEANIGKILPDLLRKHNLTREDIFLTTKVGPKSLGEAKTIAAVNNSLNALDTPYIDLCLIHWPGAQGLLPIDPQNKRLRYESWSVLEDFVTQGKIKHIGVSNYLKHHLEELLVKCKIKPYLLQNEFHPYYWDSDLLKFCHGNDIFFQAYSSLGGTSNMELIQNPTIIKIAEFHEKSPAQVLLRWAIQHKVGVIPKSTDVEHVKSNFEIFDFELTDNEMDLVDNLGKHEKIAWDPISVV